MVPNGAPGLERQLLLDELGGWLRRNSTREDARLVIAGSMEGIMNFIIRSFIKLGILKKDLDYHLLRALLVMICLFFGYQKWFDYEAQALIPYISHGPLIFWLYPLLGIRGATYFLASRNGYSEHCCSPDSGTRRRGFSGLSACVSLCSELQQSFLSYPAVGPPRPVDSLQ